MKTIAHLGPVAGGLLVLLNAALVDDCASACSANNDGMSDTYTAQNAEA